MSGIWPPDAGGPASHAPALAGFLRGRGHTVEVATTADEPPATQAYPVHWVARSLPTARRYASTVALVRKHARSADAVYATSMVRRAASGATLARRPLVVKLVSDEVFERQQREGRFSGTLDEFQREGGARVGLLRATRNRALRSAHHVLCPSAYLRDVALGWGLDPTRLSVLPNPAPTVPELPARDELREELSLTGPTLAFAGRLGPQKSLDVALEAVARLPDVTLVVAGDGPDRDALERLARELGVDGRARFLGSLPRDRVLRLFRAADASVLSSSWENLPHTVLEALAVGCPVIATAVGGVPEVVRDEENGLLVPARDPDALAGCDSPLLRGRGAARAAGGSGSRFGRRPHRGRGVLPDRGAARTGGTPVKRKLLMVGRMRYSLPLSPTLAQKFDALEEELDVRVLGSSGGGNGADPRFELAPPVRPRVLDGAAFYALLPFRVARELRRFRPDAVLVQGGQETALTLAGRALARVPTRIVADVHGDPAAATRLYGSPLRKALSPLGDVLARAGLRRADGVRTISDYTSGLVREAGVEPTATFAAFMDLEPFLTESPAPLPERPVALFVGVLERYKAVDVLADAWRLAAPRVPEATLEIVGRGTLRPVVERLVADLPQQTRWRESIPTEDVARALDDATALVLPSRSEGLGRVVVEAFCRGRGVVGSRVGGIPDLVTDGESGLLVPPGDAQALAEALVRVLGDRELAGRIGAAGRAAVEPWLATPEEYARQVRALVDEVVRP